MAKVIKVNQSTLEEKVYTVNWADSLPTNVTVTAVTTTHTPPSGNAVTPSNDVAAAPITHTYMPAGLLVGGVHYLDIVATTSNANISPHVRFEILVLY